MSGATRILGTRDMAAVVREVGLDELLDQLIERLRDVLTEHDERRLPTFDRTGFHYDKPALGLIEWMPAMDLGRAVSVKLVGYHPSNPIERGVPSIMAVTALHDPTDGRLVAVCEATFLTALRTGAASAVVTDICAPRDAGVLGVIGCGAQAVAQIHALSRVRPIERVLAYDTDEDVSASLRARLPVSLDIPVDVVSAGDIARLVGESDIVCTATTVAPGDPPVLPDVAHRPWLHVNAVGADFAGKLEVQRSLLERAVVIPDVLGQCLLEGECQQLPREAIGPDVVELVKASGTMTELRRRLTVYDSTGWALQDLVAAELVVAIARRCGIGLDVDLHPNPHDPYDPYELLRR